MQRKYTLGIIALAIASVLGVSLVSAFGFGKGFMNAEVTEEEMAEMQEQMQSMQTAIENEDYETWKTLMEERIAKMQAQITEENFNQLVERNQEMQQKREAMQQAMEEYCQENDCPNFEEGEFDFKEYSGAGHHRMRMDFDCPFASPETLNSDSSE